MNTVNEKDRSWPRCLYLFFIVSCCFKVNAQVNDEELAAMANTSYESRNLLFSHITPEHGLSQAAVNSIVQDQQGFIWIGTQEGLNRYDGKEIKVYEHDAKNPNSLSNDWIRTVAVDQDGTLWVGTDTGGINRYQREQDAFIHITHNSDDPNSLSSDRIRVIYQDRQGIFWIGTDGGGLNRFNADTGQFDHFRHDPLDPHSLPHDSVLTILEDRSGTLWVGTNGGGLARLDREHNQFFSFRHDPTSSTSLSGNRVRTLYEDRDGHLWVGTYGAGLNLFNSGTGKFIRYQHKTDDPHSISHNRVLSVFQDRDGALWVGTDKGLNQWLPDTKRFVRYQNDPTDSSSLSDNRVISIFQDRGGVLWIGTYYGINKWNYVSDTFSYYHLHGSRIKLSSNIVSSIAESAKGELWVGTYGGGLNRIDRHKGTVSYYKKNVANKYSLSDDRIMTLFIDKQHFIWAGTRNSGLNKVDPASGEIIHYLHDPQNPKSISANSITSILGEANGILWIGTYGGGLNRLDTKSNEFTVFQHDSEDVSSLSSNRVMSLYRDRSGVLWIGTEDGGLNQFVENKRTFIRYMHDSENRDSLSSNVAWTILEGTDGSLWIGTGGGGLNRWLPADRKVGRAAFQKYRKNDGLISDSIQAILEDNAGLLWLSSNRGLIRFDPDTGETRHFSRNNGLKNNDFNFAARYRDQNGTMYFGSTAGVVSFSPEQIRSNRHRPDIVLTALSRLGPIAATYSTLPQDETIELGYMDDLITFEFVGLDYAAPDKNLYKYKLDGFDEDWTEPVGFTRTTYTNLPAGNYTFRVKAANNDGFWNEQGTTIKLLVIPPPWKSPWAYAGYTLMLGCSILIYLRMQAMKLQRETKQRIELETQVKLRTSELADRNQQLLTVNEKLEEASLTDSLTGLKNRRFLQGFIDPEITMVNQRVADLKQSGNVNQMANLDIYPALSIMMIDLDGFKLINDTYGHHAGDLALLQVRDILQDCCRKSDTIIRWGGDEFLLVGRNTSARSAEKLAERIRIGLAEHQFQLENGIVARLSGSIGFALYPFLPSNPQALIWEQVAAVADRAAYVAKQNGRNAWVGIYGNNHTQKNVHEQVKDKLEFLYSQGQVTIKTSIASDLVFDDSKKIQHGGR